MKHKRLWSLLLALTLAVSGLGTAALAAGKILRTADQEEIARGLSDLADILKGQGEEAGEDVLPAEETAPPEEPAAKGSGSRGLARGDGGEKTSGTEIGEELVSAAMGGGELYALDKKGNLWLLNEEGNRGVLKIRSGHLGKSEKDGELMLISGDQLWLFCPTDGSLGYYDGQQIWWQSQAMAIDSLERYGALDPEMRLIHGFVMDGGLYLLQRKKPLAGASTVYLYDYWGSYLYRFDLTTGFAGAPADTYLTEIAPYKGGRILGMQEGWLNDSGLPEVVVINGRDLEIVDTLPRPAGIVPFGLAYDPVDAALYVTDNAQIYRLEGKKWIPVAEAANPSGTLALLSALDGRGRYASVTPGGAAFAQPGEEIEAREPLRVYGSWANLSGIVEGFLVTHPEIPVIFEDVSVYSEEELRYLLDDATPDVIELDMAYGGWIMMREGGFLNLSDQKVFAEAVEGMYPVVQDAVSYEGGLYALPVEMTVDGWMLREAQMFESRVPAPRTLAEYYLAMLDYSTRPEADRAYRFTATWWDEEGDTPYYSEVGLAVRQHLYSMERRGQVDFDTEEFRALLALSLEAGKARKAIEPVYSGGRELTSAGEEGGITDEDIEKWVEDWFNQQFNQPPQDNGDDWNWDWWYGDEWDDDWWDDEYWGYDAWYEEPLIDQRCYNPLGEYYGYSGGTDWRLYAPPASDEAGDPLMIGWVTGLVIPQGSPRQAEALIFLEYAAQNAYSINLATLMPWDQVTWSDGGDDEDLTYYREQLSQALKDWIEADEADKDAASDNLRAAEAALIGYYDSAAMVSQTALERYQSLVDNVYIPHSSQMYLREYEFREGYWDLLDTYCLGEIGVDEVIEGLNGMFKDGTRRF